MMPAQANEAQANVRWWPSALVDESMPNGLATPTTWLFERDGTLFLGVDEPQWNTDWGQKSVTVGDVVEFVAAENFGTFKMTIAEDGSFNLNREPPLGVTHWYPDEPENFFATPEELAADLFGNQGDGVFEVEAFHWGDDVPHRLEMGPAGPRFVLVKATP